MNGPLYHSTTEVYIKRIKGEKPDSKTRHARVHSQAGPNRKTAGMGTYVLLPGHKVGKVRGATKRDEGTSVMLNT